MPAWTGTKKDLCAECIQALGLDATYTAAKKWCKNRYGQEISEPQFYTVRRRIADLVAAKPAIGGAVLQQAEQLVAVPAKDSSIVALVKATKALVDKLGKEEAKNLIDAL